eukprot:TRINITY_DN6045_c0_g1_i10.p1 TRINITY_DN6045_c0_g1~~TRINITY_DN6045_c0_g1_i10.p1  ORF type:complete len:983 (+),score=204.86 TRINITY_DN6045_c0_g1_i10:565-3513(+)
MYKIRSVDFHRFLGSDGIIFRVEIEGKKELYLLARLVVNDVHLETASSVREKGISGDSLISGETRTDFTDGDVASGGNDHQWLDTILNPQFNVYYQPQGLLLKEFKCISYDCRSLCLPFVINMKDCINEKVNTFRLLFTIAGDKDNRNFVITKEISVLETFVIQRRSLMKSVVNLVNVTENLDLQPELGLLCKAFVRCSRQTSGQGNDAVTEALLLQILNIIPSQRKIWLKRSSDGRALLHYVSLLSFPSVAKYLLSRDKTLIQATDINIETALWSAIDSGCCEIVQMFLKAENGDFRNIRDIRGYNVLEFAKNRRPVPLKIVDALEEVFIPGGVGGGHNPRLEFIKSRGRSCLFDSSVASHIGAHSSHLLAFHGNPNRLESLLSSTPAYVNNRDNNGSTPLHVATRLSRHEISDKILSFHDHVDVNAKDFLGYTPLHVCCGYNNIITARSLLQRPGINPLEPNNFGLTPLHLACYFGSRELVSLLLGWSGGLERVIEVRSENTPYHVAAQQGDALILEDLIKFNPQLFLSVCSLGVTPLHLAARLGHTQCAKVLLDYNFTVESSPNGVTPLLEAAGSGHLEILKLLLEKEGLDCRDICGSTPLLVAAASGDENCVLFLIESGAQVDEMNIRGETALCVAASRGYSGMVKILLSSGANSNHVIPSTEGGEGTTPLHLAVVGGHMEVVQLLAVCSDCNAADGQGKTPLMLAVPHPPCLGYLISLIPKVKVDVRDKAGCTALFYALDKGYIQAARDMILAGADIYGSNEQGIRPIDLDMKENQDTIMDAVKTMEEKHNSTHSNIYKEAIVLFNQKASHGVDFLLKSGLLKNIPWDLAWFFMYYNSHLSKIQLGLFLGSDDKLHTDVLQAFTNRMDFSNMPYDKALRHFLQYFMLPGEAQKIDRMMECFAIRYHKSNPEVFPDSDTAYILAFSLIMLNTDQHNPSIKNKMSKEEFIRNNRKQWYQRRVLFFFFFFFFLAEKILYL